ncbi:MULTISPECIES: EAL domain-containing protein [unclassified Actinoplanes]|uniref:EAL domain-containing protein n=1 Tax=unclassified Actinoplanes TaxID=2626549 RepID=UPI001E2BC2CD|nr:MULTISPECIES: EAL domain-containing protein [unclassified Actinoplanes]
MAPTDDATARHDARPEVDRLLDKVRAQLGVEAAWVSAFGAGELTILAAAGAAGEMRLPVGEDAGLLGSLCLRVLAGTLPEIVHDVRRHPLTRDLDSATDLAIGSYAGVPWRSPDGAVAGMLCCGSRHPDPSLDQRAVRYLSLIAELISDHLSGPLAEQRHSVASARRAVQGVLDSRAVRMVFQPIVRLHDGRAVGFEALARFDPGTFAGPDRAFAAASLCGLGVPLELLALRQALRRLPELPGDAWLAVNLSADALLDADVLDTLLAHGGDRLNVEVTEHAQVSDYDLLGGALDSLRRTGIRLSVDDAGAGYASLQHILRLRPDLIKLDISLVRDIDTDPVKTALGRCLNDFATGIGARLIAEGIETAAELARLRELGVAYGQGYHLARPGALL